MNFLVWWNPATWFSDVTGNIMGAIVQGIRSLFYMLSTAVYRLITKVYNLFEVLCHARLLDDSVVKALADRIGLILGIIMLFVVTFSFIQMLINPDALEDKEKGAVSVIKRVLLVIVMLGISNFAFATLHKLQVVVINSHVISKLLLPYEVDTENFGNVLSADLFTSFYRVDSSLKDYIGTEHDVDGTIELCYDETNVLRKQIYDNNNFHLGYSCLNASAKVQDEDGKSQEVTIMDFDYLLMLGCGVAVLYFLAMYCFSVGVRTIQLSVLEILSPMAIVSYLSPKKDNMFSKWIKMYFSTYIDVFIRIGIINFVIFLISTILDSEGGWTFWESVGNPTDDFTVILISIVMILALLTFAKKAPDMLKDLFPAGASKLGFGASMKDVVGLNGLQKGVRTAAGLGAAAATGLAVGAYAGKGLKGKLTGALGGFAGGAFRGARAGFGSKSIGSAISSGTQKQSAVSKRMAQLHAEGGSWLGSKVAGFQETFGLRTRADKLDLEKSKLEAENSAYTSFDGYLDAAEKRAEAQILKGKFSSNGHATEALKQKNLAEIYRQQSATIKRSDYGTDDAYDAALADLANKAAKAESDYLNEMKSAKKDYISSALNDPSFDAPTLQNLQQAAGVVAANMNEGYTAFNGVTEADLLSGNYDSFDSVNSDAKKKQTTNNNELARNAKAGEAARVNAKYSGRGK